MISKKLAQLVLNTGLATGADFAEIYLEEIQSSTIVMENGSLENAMSNLTYGAGIRLLKNLQSVYGYTNDLSKKGLLKLAETLSKSISSAPVLSVEKIEKIRVGKHHYPKIPYATLDKAVILEKLKQANKIMNDYDPRIVRASVTFSSRAQDVTIFNSDGKEFHDHRERGRVFFAAIAAKEGAMESAFEGPGASKGWEFFQDDVDLNDKAKKTAASAILMLDAKECPSGKMPVVIGNGFGGVIFHEACGHSLEATSVAKGLSVFSGKKGQKIASDIVNAVDDGTIEGAWGSENIDDEGNKTQCNVLIKNGVLNSYLVDNFNGRRMGEKGNGACRRENYRYEPTSRMSNTFILPGDSTTEEIIANTPFGLYAKSLGGGSVNPATGEFNFAVTEAYMIKDGKIDYPVKGATLIGSGQEVLLKIDMIGKDLLRSQGMCGSSSGSIPTDVGQPTIRVSEMTVGGRGGSIK